MKRLDSQRSRALRNISGCGCSVLRDVWQWLESHGKDGPPHMRKSRHRVNGGFANALDWHIAQERPEIVAEHAQQEENRLGDLQLSSEADEMTLFASSGRRA